jgi:hypothetical protein
VVWWRGDRPRPSREVIRATIVGLGLTALVLLWMGVPYLRVRNDHPEVVRTIEDIRFLSPPVKGLLAPSPDNLLWGRALADNRGGLRWPPEMLLFPGFAMFVLAVPGLIGGWFSRRLRIGLLVAGVLTLIFALGTTIDDGNFTYKLLFDYAPGWDGPRTPGRLLVIATLPFALLAGAGVAYLGDLAARVRRAPRWAPVAVCGLAGLYGLAEGSHWQTDVPGPGLVAGPQHLAVPARPAALSTAKAPVLHLPPTEPDSYDYILWSTADWKPIVNGLSGFQPTGTGVLYSEIGGFPDAASVAALRAFHVNTVVVYPDRIVNTPYADVLSRDVRGLGVRRRVQDGIVFFDLQP